MLLSIRFLADVSGVNSFEPTQSPEMVAGDDQTLHFQLVDAALDRSDQGFSPAGRRYVPDALATLTVTVVNVDTAKQFDRVATKPFSQDTSIWSIPILPTDPIGGTVRLKVKLVEPTRVLNGYSAPGMFLRVR